ncbi:hypothetical protein [Lysinibacillus irui]|uniref:hypothetical protein n=1 Tax=Lysinibacillus irui TaxID=2998077 RepID=UPI002AD2BA35|nr:hypothetical protein [Lysinibacillus irui]MEA0565507.1 hypothetical protein [Lysinibacillus irui]
MDEEITPTETPTDQTTDLAPLDDVTNYIDVTDDRTLIGTMLHYVFGNVDVMVFIVSTMVLVTLLIISTDFMRWKGRD